MADQDQVEFGDEEEEDIIDDEEEEDIINHAEMGQKPEEIEVIEDQEDDQEDIDIEEEGLELDMAEEDDEDEHENRDRGIRYGRETFGEECIQRNKKKEEEEDNEEEDEGKKESIDMDHIHEKALGRTEEKVYQPQQGYRKEDVFSKKEIVSTQDKVDADVMDESNKEDDPMSRPPHGSEVFIGGITKDVVEDDLRELCGTCGHIYEVWFVHVFLALVSNKLCFEHWNFVKFCRVRIKRNVNFIRVDIDFALSFLR